MQPNNKPRPISELAATSVRKTQQRSSCVNPKSTQSDWQQPDITTRQMNLMTILNSELVPVLGEFPLPVEVIPMARSQVAREIVRLGGDPVYREGCITDNGNVILDVYNMSIVNPKQLEADLNAIVGVVCNGLFAARPADVLLLGTPQGVRTIERS